MRVFPLTRFLLGAVMVVLLSAAAAGGWWWREHRAPARYVTRPVTLGIIQRSVTMTGTVDPVNTVQVGSYVSGIVKEVRCDSANSVPASIHSPSAWWWSRTAPI